MKIKHKNTDFVFKLNNFGDGLYQVIILSNDEREIMGEVSFSIGRKRTWIHSIGVEQPYQYKGVGQALLDICELSSACKGVDKLEGLYCPGNEYACTFYEKNNFYFVQRDSDIIITKKINIEKTKEKMNNRIIRDDNILER